MTRQALLIGPQTNGLTGVVNDVKAMAEALRPRGFEVHELVTPHATRAAILDAYEKLIADARRDDAFVIFYSGHGGLAQSPAGPDLQFIVPDDYPDSSETNFRGITGVELSVLLARLTEVAPNTTVIMDCCHAAHMSKQLPSLRVKSLLRSAHWLPSYQTVERHDTELARGGLRVGLSPLVSNSRAVRAMACAPLESAYEITNRDGVQMGLFTDALTRALGEAAGMRLTWSTLMSAVRRNVQVFMPAQRPAVEGPAGLELFGRAELEPLNALPVVAVGPGRIQLLGAPLLAVERGDEFAIMPARATGPQDGPVIGTATVDELLPTAALAQLRLATTAQEVPVDARAYRTSAAPAALPVRLPEGHPAAAELAGAMKLRPLVRPADLETGENAPVAVVAEPDGRLVVRDDAGPLHPPHPATARGIDRVMANLQRIAQATALRRLTGDPTRPLTHQVVVEWGRVRAGRPEPLPLTGALLFAHAGEHVYVRLRNDGEQPMYVSLIDIGVSYRIEVLTAADQSGVLLVPGGTYTYGWNEDLRRLTGLPVSWPDGPDRTLSRPETILALISDEPVDVSALRNREVRGDLGKGARPGIEQILDQIGSGRSRNLLAAAEGQARFDVRPIDFSVSPTSPPATERATFLFDDRPELPVRLLSARGEAPARIAVRIAELVVHRNRALRSADIRVDAIVLTGGTGDEPVYRAQTMRFSNVGDEYRLPLDNVLIYHGPAVDFIDLAVWVSRDVAGSLALGDLLARQLGGPGMRGLIELAQATPQAGLAAAAVTALSAGAVLVNTAYEVLTGVVGQSIGLYRTSLLAQERFGTGRHERHAQDFSFTFLVETVG